MRKILYLLMVLLFLQVLLHADKYSGESLNLGVGVRAMSMGNSFVAVADDPSAVYWNAAGLVQNSNSIDVNLMHSEQYSGVLKYDALALSYPMQESSTLGFMVTRIGVGDIYFTELENPDDSLSSNNPPIIESSENYSDYTTYVSFSSKFNEEIFWGLTSKFIYKKAGDISATGLGLDAGLFAQLRSNIKAGINIRDIFGTRIWWKDSDSDVVNPNVLAGAAIDFVFPVIKRDATFSLQTDFFFEDRDKAAQIHYGNLSADLHAGMNIELAKYVSLFTGIDRDKFTAGIELFYGNYILNYGFYSQPEINNTHRISLGINYPSIKL
ncbi:MAG: PorV/PorQ family protein [Candidatus Cloacimonetes bacterium]|nr:PorV/PorQ family protein [Candidatus Cloacimonadota bacterium]